MDPVKYSMRYGHCMNCGWEGPETEMSALWPVAFVLWLIAKYFLTVERK